MRRLIALLGRGASFFLFRRRQVVGRDRLEAGRPTLLVANHFNGFVDPVVVAAAMGRSPRFIAKAALKRVPGVGPLLRSLGVVFVQRRQDGDGTAANTSAFRHCHEALAARDVVCIFPEGTTHDRPRLDPIRTGAARIVLGARAAGAERPVIVPVGLTYPDKLAIRSAVLVEFGEPIELDAVVDGDAGEDDHEAVRTLTDAIDGGLRAVSPDFDGIDDWLTFELAAEVAMRTGAERASLHDRARAARAVAEADDDTQDHIRSLVGRYAALLIPLRLSDGDVVARTSSVSVLGAAVRAGIWVALLGSLVVATFVVNVLPMALVVIASLRTRTPITKGTVRVLVGLVAFPLSWVIGGIVAADGIGPVSLAVLIAALGAVSAVALIDLSITFARRATAWYQTRERSASVEFVAEVRQQVVESVRRLSAPTSESKAESVGGR